MNNLVQIILIVAWLAVPVSIWGIVYFVGRIYLKWRIKKECGDMPSIEEIRALYEHNNAVIQYRDEYWKAYFDHSPTDKT